MGCCEVLYIKKEKKVEIPPQQSLSPLVWTAAQQWHSQHGLLCCYSHFTTLFLSALLRNLLPLQVAWIGASLSLHPGPPVGDGVPTGARDRLSDFQPLSLSPAWSRSRSRSAMLSAALRSPQGEAPQRHVGVCVLSEEVLTLAIAFLYRIAAFSMRLWTLIFPSPHGTTTRVFPKHTVTFIARPLLQSRLIPVRKKTRRSLNNHFQRVHERKTKNI